ncbi:methyl-accepting chemotaxis protein, partial [Helicobacter sp. 11S02629-2]|uniref:methyl-accepting chemotaxis protein n=1 Tax=Helicobacter sp. 11S02629-2 TaxID=1476195 RepID=UPI000BA5278F
MKKQISLKVAVVVVIVTFIVMLVLSIIAAVNTSNAMNRSIKQTLSLASESMSTLLQGKITQSSTSMSVTASKASNVIGHWGMLPSSLVAPEVKSLNNASDAVLSSLIYAKTKTDDPRYVAPDGNTLLRVISNADGDSTFVSNKEAFNEIESSSVIRSALEGKISMGRPAVKTINGKEYNIVQLAVPIIKDGKVIGVVAQLLNLHFMQKIISDMTDIPEGDIIRSASRYLIYDGVAVVSNVASDSSKRIGDIRLFSGYKGFDSLQTHFANGDDFYEKISSDGTGYILVNNSFKLDKFGTLWNVLVAVPTSVALHPLTTLIWIIVITAIVAIIIIVLFFYFYIDKAFIKRVRNIQATLIDAFAVINHEKAIHINKLDSKSKDELGVISNVINEAMDKTRNSLSKDSSAVSQALEVAKTIEEGNLSIRITKNPANPQLLELKDVLNNMLDVLETKIGSNMNEIERVFDSYLRLDFSTSVLDDKGNIANKGSVERVTNALGEEIRKMLKSSLSFASLLNEEAKKLNTQITNLSTSSNAQASSLEQSATAIEEITQSMQN